MSPSEENRDHDAKIVSDPASNQQAEVIQNRMQSDTYVNLTEVPDSDDFSDTSSGGAQQEDSLMPDQIGEFHGIGNLDAATLCSGGAEVDGPFGRGEVEMSLGDEVSNAPVQPEQTTNSPPAVLNRPNRDNLPLSGNFLTPPLVPTEPNNNDDDDLDAARVIAQIRERRNSAPAHYVPNPNVAARSITPLDSVPENQDTDGFAAAGNDDTYDQSNTTSVDAAERAPRTSNEVSMSSTEAPHDAQSNADTSMRDGPNAQIPHVSLYQSKDALLGADTAEYEKASGDSNASREIDEGPVDGETSMNMNEDSHDEQQSTTGFEASSIATSVNSLDTNRALQAQEEVSFTENSKSSSSELEQPAVGHPRTIKEIESSTSDTTQPTSSVPNGRESPPPSTGPPTATDASADSGDTEPSPSSSPASFSEAKLANQAGEGLSKKRFSAPVDSTLSGSPHALGGLQDRNVVMAELKVIKIASIHARSAVLEAEIATLTSRLEETTQQLEAPAAETVKQHIKLLHDYNDIRDVGQGLIGMIADGRSVRIGDIYPEFGIDLKD